MYSTPELFFTKDPRVPEQQKDLLISFTLPPELPKNWVRPWLGMAAIRRPIPTQSSTVPLSSTRICQREHTGGNHLHEQCCEPLWPESWTYTLLRRSSLFSTR